MRIDRLMREIDRVSEDRSFNERIDRISEDRPSRQRIDRLSERIDRIREDRSITKKKCASPGLNQINRKHGSPASAFSPAGSALSPAS